MGKANYQVVVQEETQARSFHYKKEAIEHARGKVKVGMRAHIESRQTGQMTYMLFPQQTSCSVCGNELDSKQHCPLCGRLHAY